MSQYEIEVQLVTIIVAITCALPGVFLLLRRMSMMSDAISHAILPGIVIAFLITKNINSPFLVIAAALTGVVTVSLVEMLNKTRLMKEDAAIGLVFPALFSIGVILVSRFTGNVHLDTDAVLLGEPAFIPFNRLIISGYDFGPASFFVMGIILLVNVIFILLFYKELKLSSFDPGLAMALGFFPGIVHYGLMTLVSVTVVGAFDAVGSILVVALMIAPPATAYLMTDRLPKMLMLSGLIGAISAVIGFRTAWLFDTSIAGSMATISGVIFFMVFFLAPQRGIIASARRHAEQRWKFAATLLAVHLFNHEGLPEEATERKVAHLHEHLRWKPEYASRIIKRAERGGYIIQKDGNLYLTQTGHMLAKSAIEMLSVEA